MDSALLSHKGAPGGGGGGWGVGGKAHAVKEVFFLPAPQPAFPPSFLPPLLRCVSVLPACMSLYTCTALKSKEGSDP